MGSIHYDPDELFTASITAHKSKSPKWSRAMDIFEGKLKDVEDGTLARLLWKLDMCLLLLLRLTYALQSIYNTTRPLATQLFLVSSGNLHLKSTEFSWLGALFYLA
ncbi:hypothetical protein BJY00DRAFT_319103 [Aspergillus carlsbadensis]|nr:hypothetical protein BJY00DRAFT_319103 [Aspergillus carlsbadensis]